MAFLIFFFSVILPIKNGICLKDNQLTTTTATKATKKKKKGDKYCTGQFIK